MDPALSEYLGRIPYGSVATVNLLYDKLDVKHPLDGFGFVVPDVERRGIIGCSFSSVKFPGRAPEGKVLLRAYLGGKSAEKTLQEPDEEILELVSRDLNELLGIRAKPLWVRIRKHASTMPQYQVGHLDLIQSIERRAEKTPGIFFAGNAFHGVGIPDCVRSAEKAAEKAVFNAL
jgi:oxygen-dependent protoporphyrinogen oxidase